MGRDIRIDLDAIAARFDGTEDSRADMLSLIEEVRRLDSVIGRWADAWKRIIAANAEAWEDRVKFLTERVEMLERLL